VTTPEPASRTILLNVVDANNKPLNGARLEQYVNGKKIATTTMGDRPVRFEVSRADAAVEFIAYYNGHTRKAIPNSDGVSHIQFDEVRLPGPPPSVLAWFPLAGVLFAVFLAASLFYLIIQPTAIAQGNRIVFDVWVAFCLAASASFLGGEAVVRGGLPFPFAKERPVTFAAVGGIAVFIVALLVLVNVYR
jgi:hypothetical protein